MFRLFVRWNLAGEGQHKVDLELDGQTIQTSGVIGDSERAYGYCRGVVDTLKRLGISIEMPHCLTGRHLTPNMSRED